MNTLNKYLVKESLIPFLLSLGVITTVLFLQFLIRAIDRFLGKGLDVWIILEYLYLNLAWIIALSVPMSLLISTVMTYGRMSQDNEITALKAAGVTGMTVSEVKGFGRQKGHTEVYRGAEYEIEFIPKVQIEIAVPDDKVDSVITAIQTSANTDKIGDGKIFVLPIEQAIRIRTGESGDSAV